jgi:DNA invertase Pin-like site-specific DNA recombinase
MKQLRCGIYSRVSTSKQDAENQLRQLHEFAGTLDWKMAADTVYVDQITGKHSDRAEFQRMFMDASKRRFDVLLFWSLDRLSREGALETLQHLNRLTGYGVQWRSLTEQYLDSTGVFKDAVVSILAVVAKQERVRLSERTIAGLQRARAEGKQLGRRRGWRKPGEVSRVTEWRRQRSANATA